MDVWLLRLARNFFALAKLVAGVCAVALGVASAVAVRRRKRMKVLRVRSVSLCSVALS